MNLLATLQQTFEDKVVLSPEDRIVYRNEITDLANQMLALPQDQHAVVPVKTWNANGTHTRQVTIPKGSLVVGRIHKFETINIMTKGKITVASEEGLVTVQAPYVYVSGPGIQKIAFAHEDTEWLNVFATKETDPEKVLDLFTVDPKTYLDFYVKGELCR